MTEPTSFSGAVPYQGHRNSRYPYSLVIRHGMPQATEDLQALLGALSHVVVESGMDDPEGCVTHLDRASDAAEALRVMESDEMALAHREYVREMEDDERRAGY